MINHKRMEKALRLSKVKLSKAFLASPYVMLISTMEKGTLIEVNDSFLRFMGISREDAVRQTSFELGVWTRPAYRDEIMCQLRNTGRVTSKEIRIQSKNGRRFLVSYSGRMIELGGRDCVLSFCEDITERKRVEERLREYEKAVEGVEEMIAVVGRDYRYLLANRAFVSFQGRTKEQIVGRFVSDVVGQVFFKQVVMPKLDEAFAGAAVKYEKQYTHPSLGKRDLFVSYLPLEGLEGIDRVVCVQRDITERKNGEQELRRLSGELLRLQDDERRKIARDLHDTTGQDLVALAATLSQLHDAIPSTNRKCRKLLAQCQGVSARSLREVRTLSYLLHPPMLDESGLEDAVHVFAEGYEARTGIHVELEISPHFGRLPEGIELALFRVVQESLVNIQRHSGSFTAKIELNHEPEEVCLNVSDTGHGIASSQGKQNGRLPLHLGVGIPSMEERVKQVGGRLQIDSTDSGTTVRVTVPTHA